MFVMNQMQVSNVTQKDDKVDSIGLVLEPICTKGPRMASLDSNGNIFVIISRRLFSSFGNIFVRANLFNNDDELSS